MSTKVYRNMNRIYTYDSIPSIKKSMKDSASIPHPPMVLQADSFTFQLSKKIGEGGFAKCYQVVELPSGRKYALKTVFIDAIIKMKAKNKLLNEIDIHSNLDHRHIVKLYKVFKDDQFIYLVMELCENRTLVDLLKAKKTLCEAECRYYIWMILMAVKYLHDHFIIHRDLKLGNIFLNLDYDVKIGDFGLATTLDQVHDRKKTICGTPNYIAPEILFDKERGHSFEVDIWTVGIILYTLLFGKPPFQSTEVKAIYRNIKHNNYSFPSGVVVSEAAKDLIRTILTSDPEKRPKVDSIFSHAFFSPILIKQPDLLDLRTFKNECLSLFLHREKCSTAQPTQSIPLIEKENVVPEKMQTWDAQGPKLSMSKEKKNSVFLQTFQTLNRYLEARGDPVARLSISGPTTIPPSPVFYIEKWIDYTSKYGIGYLCSVGTVGAYFNDGSSIIMNGHAKTIEYLSPFGLPTGQSRSLNRSLYALADVPVELNKKSTIISHFYSFFQKNAHIPTPEGLSSKNMELVLKFAKVQDAIIFRLSTRSIQIIFEDNLSIICSEEGAVLTLLDLTRGLKETFWLSSVISCTFLNLDKLFERLEWFKSHLGSFILQKNV